MIKKIIKKNLMVIIGMMVAIGTVAFTAPKNEMTDSLVWYEFTQHMSADPGDPENYTNIGSLNPAECDGSVKLCAIRASDTPEGTPDPIELGLLQSEISDGEPTDNVTFKN